MFSRVLGPNLYSTCRCPPFLLDVVYSKKTSTHCDRNGNNNTFSDLDVAKISCSADEYCVGLYDDCGFRVNFRHCTAPLSIKDSSCGSILYQPLTSGK